MEKIERDFSRLDYEGPAIYWKPTLWFFLKAQLIFLILSSFSLLVRDQWSGEGSVYFVFFALSYQIPVFATTLVSFFSKPNEMEGVLKDTVSKSSIPVLASAFIITPVSTLPFTDNFPFPVSMVFLLSIFGLFFALGGMISQRLAVRLINSSSKVMNERFISRLISLLTTIHFYPVYLLLSRTISLPWYLRKPVAVIVFLGWTFVFFSLIGIIDA